MRAGEEVGAKLVAVCVAELRTVMFRGHPVSTGIYKLPVEGPVMVRTLNLAGDAQADLKVHGGIDKAVYCYPSEHYEAWKEELGRPLSFGTFGENLTVAGLFEDEVRVEDVLAVGEASLQVTQPRLPCFKLGIKMRDQRFLRKFLRSGRSGFYCRVLQEGNLEAGQPIRLLERNPARPTISSLLRQ